MSTPHKTSAAFQQAPFEQRGGQRHWTDISRSFRSVKLWHRWHVNDDALYPVPGTIRLSGDTRAAREYPRKVICGMTHVRIDRMASENRSGVPFRPRPTNG